jgi:hypothetical protein
MRVFTAIFGMLGLLSHLAGAPAAAETTTADPTGGLELLSGFAYWDGTQVRVLALSRQRAPDVPPAEATKSPRDPWSVMSKQPGVYEGTPLVLVESTLGDLRSAKTLWKGRATELKFQAAEAWFDADVVRDEGTGAVYIVVLQGELGSLELRVFLVPGELTGGATSRETVTEARLPLAKFLISLWSDEFCDSRKIDVSSDQAGLLIMTKATDDRCRQIGYRFEPASGAWTQVSLKRIETAKPKEKKGEH